MKPYQLLLSIILTALLLSSCKKKTEYKPCFETTIEDNVVTLDTRCTETFPKGRNKSFAVYLDMGEGKGMEDAFNYYYQSYSGSSNLFAFRHYYSNTGSYKITFRIVSEYGDHYETSQNITINNLRQYCTTCSGCTDVSLNDTYCNPNRKNTFDELSRRINDSNCQCNAIFIN